MYSWHTLLAADLVSKSAALKVTIGGKPVHIGGMCKVGPPLTLLSLREAGCSQLGSELGLRNVQQSCNGLQDQPP
jgi:hypothetical protein